LKGKEKLKMSEQSGRHLLAPESERAPGQGRPNSQKSGKQKSRYLIEPDLQTGLYLLAPMIVFIAILAFAGGQR
jgi:hypothetical protein